jgi:hypothetical protein
MTSTIGSALVYTFITLTTCFSALGCIFPKQ